MLVHLGEAGFLVDVGIGQNHVVIEAEFAGDAGQGGLAGLGVAGGYLCLIGGKALLVGGNQLVGLGIGNYALGFRVYGQKFQLGHLGEHLDHGIQLLGVLLRVAVLLGNLDENLVAGVQDLHFARTGGVQAFIEDIAGLLHVIRAGRGHFALVVELGLHFKGELHAAADVDTIVHAVEEQRKQRERAQTNDEECAGIAFYFILFCGQIPEKQDDEQNAYDEVERRGVNDALQELEHDTYR
ncbi:MAG: hypothetical protein UHH87_01115 [Akkermansia sp.]|nr:hypothetical protein [Akkermansia sp.]